MAIKACEYIRTEELTASLIALMGDRSYYVRSQAAQALLRADKGRGILEGIAATAEDDYARDMAEQWLERGCQMRISELWGISWWESDGSS